MPSAKLYKVTPRGLEGSYVVAKDPTEAVNLVQEYYSRNSIGDYFDREVRTIELLAEAKSYPDCKSILFVNGDPK